MSVQSAEYVVCNQNLSCVVQLPLCVVGICFWNFSHFVSCAFWHNFKTIYCFSFLTAICLNDYIQYIL
jgi:hypothetical protein